MNREKTEREKTGDKKDKINTRRRKTNRNKVQRFGKDKKGSKNGNIQKLPWNKPHHPTRRLGWEVNWDSKRWEFEWIWMDSRRFLIVRDEGDHGTRMKTDAKRGPAPNLDRVTARRMVKDTTEPEELVFVRVGEAHRLPWCVTQRAWVVIKTGFSLKS